MNHEIKWKERDIYDLMFGKMCLKGDFWEDVNCPHNKRREKDVTEKFKQIKNWVNRHADQIHYSFLFFIFYFLFLSQLSPACHTAHL